MEVKIFDIIGQEKSCSYTLLNNKTTHPVFLIILQYVVMSAQHQVPDKLRQNDCHSRVPAPSQEGGGRPEKKRPGFLPAQE